MTEAKMDRRIQRQRERRARKQAPPRTCQKCNGLGAVRSVYPSAKDNGCYWFTSGARTCPSCDGTGEAHDMRAASVRAMGGDPDDFVDEGITKTTGGLHEFQSSKATGEEAHDQLARVRGCSDAPDR